MVKYNDAPEMGANDTSPQDSGFFYAWFFS